MPTIRVPPTIFPRVTGMRLPKKPEKLSDCTGYVRLAASSGCSFDNSIPIGIKYRFAIECSNPMETKAVRYTLLYSGAKKRSWNRIGFSGSLIFLKFSGP